MLDTMKPKKIALVHDFLVSYGGAERVFQAISELYPEAPIYTLVADQEIVRRHFPGRDIRTSWLSGLPKFIKKRYRFFLPFFPAAVEAFDLRDFDLVISSSGAWCKGIVTRLNTKHIAYLHSPMRYAWDYHEQYLGELGAHGKFRIFTRMLLSYLRVWDRQAAERPDFLLANSHFTEERIRKYYRRESTVIYPGALTLAERAAVLVEGTAPKRKHFLLVSRLTHSKRVDIAIEAFNKLGLPLVVVGTGPERQVLEKRANENIRFAGFVEDSELANLYRGARALIFPSEEDFGMTAVEALSFGVPVIAFEYGGIREIMEPGKSGELFEAQTPEILAEGVRRFLVNEGKYDEARMKQSVAHLTKERFQKEIREFIEEHIY
jgi:glycosyltransferase involved in cell wall biosynthesis